MKRLGLFLLISFGFSWLVALVIGLFGMYSNYEKYGFILTILLIIYMFGPALASLVVQKIDGKRLSDLGISFKFNIWWIWGILSIVLVAIINVFLIFILGGGFNSTWEQFRNSIVSLYSSKGVSNDVIIGQLEKVGKSVGYNVFIYYAIVVISGVAAGITINALAAFGEELGWRGFLFEEFKSLGFVKSSFLIGGLWGVWHAPLIAMGHNFPNHPFEGIFVMVIFCVVFSFIMNYFREKSGSVILSSMMHGVLNGIAGLGVITSSVRNDILYNIVGISGIVSVMVILGIIILDKKLFGVKEA